MVDEELSRNRHWLEEKVRAFGYSPAGLTWGPADDDRQGLRLDGIRRALKIDRADLDHAAEGKSPEVAARLLQEVRHWLSATRRG
jgi:hypothetical protein